MSYNAVKFMPYPKLITSALAVGFPTLYLLYIHAHLSRKVDHTTSSGNLTASTVGNIDSVPSSAVAEECFMVHDIASKAVPTSLLPTIEQPALLTLYLRYNMVRFSRLPQAWILRLMCTSSERETFKLDHIQNLDFKEGDVVCGGYTVVVRTAGKVEFAMKPVGPVNGRLVIAVEERGKDSIFSSETIMWKGRDKTFVMPLERGLGRWMHELASWWLLDSGTKYLISLRQER